ncbi:MAG: hypothetical protein JO000_20975 [Alphaproteobacteria bacterium]|nr:hypothetical protein [Alphaproteobacteria bacterium]
MSDRTLSDNEFARRAANPRSSASLVPMLVAGLVMITIGMVVAVMLS